MSARRRPNDADLAGLPAALLGRVSGEIQESDGYSLPNQQRRCRETAAELGVEVVGEDFEQGSGQDWDLAGLNRWLRAAKAGTIKVLILKNVTRLSRRRAKQGYIEYLAERDGLLLYYYDESYEDNAAGRLQRGIMAEVAEFQLEQSREDSMAARYEKVEHHQRPVGNGPVPYGWKRIVDRSGAKPRTVGYEHHPEHAAVIRRFRALRTTSTRELAERLNREGVPIPATYRPSEKRPRSDRWEPYTIRHILANKMIWGEYRYGERERYRVNGKWRQRLKAKATVKTLQFEPILERWEVEELRAIISGRHRKHTTSWQTDGLTEDPFVLRGVLICGVCQTRGIVSRLVTHTVGGRSRSGGQDRYYRCPLANQRTAERRGVERCTLPPVAADRHRRGAGGGGIEELVWDAVEAFFSTESAMRAAIRRARERDDSAEQHADRLAFSRRTLAQKREAFFRTTDRWAEADDPLDRESLEATRQTLKRDIVAYEAEVRHLEQVVPRGIGDAEEAALLALGADMRDAQGAWTPAEQRAFLAQLGMGVTVMPADRGRYAVGRHRYDLAGEALGERLRSSDGESLTYLSLQLLRSDGVPLLTRRPPCVRSA